MAPFFKKKEENKDQQSDSSISWPDHVESLTHDTFDDFIKKYPLSVIDFWAPWCAPCKTMLSRLRRLERVYHRKVAFGRVNIQEEKKIGEKYKVMGVPILVFSITKRRWEVQQV